MSFSTQFRLYQIKLPYSHDEKALAKAIVQKLGILETNLLHWKIIKRSLDTRPPKAPQFIYCIDVTLNKEIELPKSADLIPPDSEETKLKLGPQTLFGQIPPIIVGSGPAGLFAGYWLSQLGYCPIILEQGEAIEERHHTLTNFFETRQLHPYSNYVFGEGGAGTYSDGKLYTGIASGWISEIIKTLIHHGAPDSLCYESPPHIGSDRLRAVMIRMRKQIQAWHGEFRFRHRVIGIEWSSSTQVAMGGHSLLNSNYDQINYTSLSNSSSILPTSRPVLVVERPDKTIEKIATSVVIWATGSHCQDTFMLLQKAGIPMVAKPFQIGVRIEHPQAMINQRQYRQYANDPLLPSANYRLVMPKLAGIRQMCSFCMCPGGEIIPATDGPGLLVTNGMSNYHKDSGFANSALVITLDLPDFYNQDVLDGLIYRSQIEKNAFILGGSNYTAPAQRAQDFLHNISSSGVLESSYRLKLRPTTLRTLLPSLLIQSLEKALPIFNQQIPGFIKQGILIAPETRASCPVRILRNPETRQSLASSFIYPVGEGAGYAGGIISAAVDGLKTVAKIVSIYAPIS